MRLKVSYEEAEDTYYIFDGPVVRATAPTRIDAVLFAAAPELLAACREAVSAITYLLSNDDDDPNYADTLNTLAAALAKAEGRTEKCAPTEA